jgi:hypothetical protein
MASIINTQLSPGVNVSELDLTTVIPTLGTTTGAIAGVFNWGPVGERILISNESSLVNTFGKPTSNNAETWFTSANFLTYGNSLYVVRVGDVQNSNVSLNVLNGVAFQTSIANTANEVILNAIDFNNKHANGYNFDANTRFVAKYPGAIGNSLKVSVCDSTEAFNSTLNMAANAYSSDVYYVDVEAAFSVNIGSNSAVVTVTSGSANASAANGYATYLWSSIANNDYILVGNTAIGKQYMQVSNTTPVVGGVFTVNFKNSYKLATPFVANTTQNDMPQRYWEYYNIVDGAPITTSYVANQGNTVAVDGMHIIVADKNGKITGVPGAILETYKNVSRATDAQNPNGQTNYYKNIVNQQSAYLWAINDITNAHSNTALNITSSTNETPIALNFTGGQDGATEADASLALLASGYDKFASATDVQVSLILQGKPMGGSTTSGDMTVENFYLANYLIDNIAENRKDCVVFITPDDKVLRDNSGAEADALVNWRNAIHSSSYAVMDSGYKYQYDRYNDVYRFIPTNGDIAGLCVRTDLTTDPWYSPAGLNRGQIKNVVKMRFNPSQAERDRIYSNSINPVVTLPAQGTVLYGDKTLLNKPSAFDRINVRRLFITLEQSIKRAAQFTMFEFNDAFTRAQFNNLVSPYLRDIKARRGISDYLVICDETNNTPERIDRNEFWGDIYIKPTRSANYIQLNFIAVATGVQFTQIVGSY